VWNLLHIAYARGLLAVFEAEYFGLSESLSCDNNDLVTGGPAGGGGGARVSVDWFFFYFCGDGKSV
jgi:hypothetical protein